MAISPDTISTSELPSLADAPAVASATARPRSRWITDWDPENLTAWEAGGDRIAHRNLVFSILSEHVGFCVWSLWSVFILFLGKEYGLTPADKFLLTSTPAAVGAALRLPYTLAVARFGGRNWTVVSAFILLIPTSYIAVVLKPGVSLKMLLLGAALAGVGGGNFSSSMANIDSFYPQRLKGWALGLNAGGGNIGVAATQLVGLAVLTLAGRNHPRLLLAVYMPLIVVSALCAARYMDNLTSARNDKRALRDVAQQRHTWLIAMLYIGTFGSFIGFSFAFGQVLLVQFSSIFTTPVKAAYLTFLGPLLGSLTRPAGGKLADRYGGALVTTITFTFMMFGGTAIVVASVNRMLWLFLAAFVVLFMLAGIGNGSIYKMIPTIFRSQAQDALASGFDSTEADRVAKRRSRALIGVTGAIGSFGGVLVNLALRQSFLSTGTGTRAYAVFVCYYAICVGVTYTAYLRPRSSSLLGV